MKLRFGFIGVGAMGFSHVNSFAKLCADTVEISAVCGRNEENLGRVREVAPGARMFRSATELIQSPLDAIVVSTPNATHGPLALEILGAGKHLYLEKPCGITRKECREIVAASVKSDRVVMIGHELRYSPYFQKIKAMIEAGDIGAPHLVWCREFRGPLQKKSGDWIQDDRKSGGALVDKNCHHFDLMNWWVGARPKRVAAFGGCAVNRVMEGPHQVHDHATMSFEYENGVRGSHQLCLFALDFPREDLEMGMIGDCGLLQTRISRMEILLWKRGMQQKEPMVQKINARPGTGWGSHLGFDEIHEGFVKCVRENRRPLTGVRDCVDGTLLGIAAEESIKTGRVIDVL